MIAANKVAVTNTEQLEFEQAVRTIETLHSAGKREHARQELRALVSKVMESQSVWARSFLSELSRRFSHLDDVVEHVGRLRRAWMADRLTELKARFANDPKVHDLIDFAIESLPSLGDGYTGLGFTTSLSNLISQIAEYHRTRPAACNELIDLLDQYFRPRLQLRETLKTRCERQRSEPTSLGVRFSQN